jgi:aminoglycoside phosphotransferase (APT) family kinase protein
VELVEKPGWAAHDGLSVERLEAFLRARMELPPGPLSVEQLPHGHSNLTYLIRCGDQRWILRRPPPGDVASTAHDMRREHRFMSVMYGSYPLAPRSVLYCDDVLVIGAPFHVVEYRAGVVAREAAPFGTLRDERTFRALCDSVVESLARLHAVDYEAVGLADAGRPEGYVARQVDGWSRRYQKAATEAVPEMTELSVWLATHVPQPLSASVVHNDFKFDNLLLDPADLTRIVGVLDWEMSTIGDPGTDFGTTLALWFEPSDAPALRAVRPGPSLWPGALSRAELVDAYAARSGRLPADAVPFYYCYGLFKLAVIFQQSYARYLRGDTRDPRFASYRDKVAALAAHAAATIETGRI